MGIDNMEWVGALILYLYAMLLVFMAWAVVSVAEFINAHRSAEERILRRRYRAGC